MSQHLIRDVYGSEFPIDSSALAFWEHREGYEVIGPLPGEEQSPELPAEPTPEPSGIPKTSSKAVRPAQDKE
ncbi:hypothetical protein ACIBEJ_35080 [Nonomuraea sp. NPDC050790]|uniref:hypothetical protein n=1 Tax=Nonomuraea sp. NPDC050790 TaxID=3364371 RepID=UPI0037887EDB